ncbi:protein of unknown function [Thiomonas sp. OC7]|nr:protein of unknown function [Thiomonas sp. OC7]
MGLCATPHWRRIPPRRLAWPFAAVTFVGITGHVGPEYSGPSQAPSAAVDKAAQQPLTDRFATTVSDGSWTIEIH